MRRLFAVAVAVLLSLAAAAPRAEAATAHDFSFVSIEGETLPMAAFRGKAVLLVNTASRCGYTHQYDGLQALYDAYRDRGLVVLGAPSNDFRQELSSNAAVKEFCEVNFGLDFPMTEIVRVTGAGAHPLFAWMAAQGAAPRWNFHKFLIAPDGALLGEYGSSTAPDSPALRQDIEAALASAE